MLARLALSLALLLGACPEVEEVLQAQSAQPSGPGYVVVATFDHDPEAFTQGLEFKGDRLFETTGLEGESSLRLVDLETGDVTRRKELAAKYFGEGMTIFGGRLYWLTWQHERGFEYDPNSFMRTGGFRYKGEGWGLTHNRRQLIMSNGSSELVFRDPKTFEIERRIDVVDEDGAAVDRLNELEWVQGEIFANVWQTTLIARIDPSSGEVVGWIDLMELHQTEQTQGNPDVTNGIAYLKKDDRLFVTGKWWAHVYEIRLTN